MQCETLIWDERGRPRDAVLARLVAAIATAPTAIAFHAELPQLAEAIAAELGLRPHEIASEDAYKCKMQGPTLHGYASTDHARNYTDL